MTKSLLLILLISFCIVSSAISQERLVSGTLTDEYGEPIPGVNILIKGTTIGTVSDLDGKYSIGAPMGATLVFSFIGYASYEVVVNAANSHPVGQSDDAIPIITPTKKKYNIDLHKQSKRGVARLGEASPGFILKSSNYTIRGLPTNPIVANAYSIRYISPKWARLRYGNIGKSGLYFVKDRINSQSPVQLTATSAFTIDNAYKLPSLQNQYAQGRPINGKEVWQGAERGEVFSWGPKLANLAYDGNVYAYDNNGELVAKGTGNGQPANIYNPYTFLRKGLTVDNSLSLHKTWGETSFNLGIQRKQQTYIIPNSHYYRNNFHFKINTPIVYRLEASYALYYSESEGNLLQRGANMASIFSGLLRSSPSFDNRNGLESKGAIKAKSAYLLENGRQRSYSPGNSDNPYFLINTLPDHEKLKTVLSTLSLKYYTGNAFTLNYSLGIDKQWGDNQFGLAPLSSGAEKGRLTNRHDDQTTLHSIIAPAFRQELGDFSLNISSTYDLSFKERSLERIDSYGFQGKEFNMIEADTSFATSILRNRYQHEWMNSAKLSYYNVVDLTLSNQSYFSSTVSKNKSFLPGAGINFVFTNINPLSSSSLLPYGRVYASYSQSVNEAPLLYGKWHFNSTNQRISDYLQYVESQELAFIEGLQPEDQRKWEYGAAFNLFNYHIGVEFAYSDKLTKNVILPFFTSNGFRLSNQADIQNKAYDISLQYQTLNSPLYWSSKMTFSRFSPIVTKLYNPEGRIPIAGFKEVSSNLVEGQPYGIIYGNTFLRNSEGKIVIGANGFPLVDTNLKPIGNPNPDWIAGIENNFRWKYWELTFVIDIRKGGDVWNGTGNALNYFGMSKRTEQAREIRKYIFEGVREDGTINNQVVDFANPADGLSGNRWVQYGINGVAEEAIEDGSYIRLNELRFSYRLDKLLSPILPGSAVTLSLLGKNLFLLTRYSGVDPETTLYGYQAGSGLDFFNMLATRSYGASLQIKL
jgi:hypothetical protein